MNKQGNKKEKFSFLGISLSNVSNIESAVAMVNHDLKIITLDKLFSVNDIKYFLNNLPGKDASVIMVSIPENEVMLSSKWKYNSRTYDLVNFDTKMLNRDDWTNRFSTRGNEYFKLLRSQGVDIYRFDIENMKDFLGCSYSYKSRTPSDCKALQDTLRMKYNMHELPQNMLPAAQLEALMGAILAKMFASENDVSLCKQIGFYGDLPIVGV